MSFKGTPPTRPSYTELTTSHTLVPPIPRAWYDRNGEFLADAYYCGTVGNMVRLQEIEGEFRDIPVSVLSRGDITYLNSLHADQSAGRVPPFYYPPTPSGSPRYISNDDSIQPSPPTVQGTSAVAQSDRYGRDQSNRRSQRNRPNNILTNPPDGVLRADTYSLEAPHVEPPPYQPTNTSMSSYSQTGYDARYTSASSGPMKSTARDWFSNDSAPADWFKIFLDAGCEIQDCMRYESVVRHLQIDSKSALSLKANELRTMGLDKDDIMRIMDAVRMSPVKTDFSDMVLPDTPAIIAFTEATFSPFPYSTTDAHADSLQAGSSSQGAAPHPNSTTVLKAPSRQRQVLADSNAPSTNGTARHGAPSDAMAGAGGGKVTPLHKEGEPSNRRQYSVDTSSISSSGRPVASSPTVSSVSNVGHNIRTTFSASRRTVQSTADNSSITTLLHTALPPLMSHGIPSSQEVSSTPLPTAPSAASRVAPLDNGISEPVEPAKDGESPASLRDDDSNLPNRRSSTSTQRRPPPNQSLAPPIPLPITNEFDPPELRRGVSIESLNDDFRLQQIGSLSAVKEKETLRPAVDIAPRERKTRRTPRKGIPAHISSLFQSAKTTASRPADSPDLFLALVNSRGIVRQSIADLCQNLRMSVSSADARIVSFIRRREATGIRHEFVLIQARYPNSKTIWMRLERGVKGSISIFRLKSTAPADDVATLAGDAPSLIDVAKIPSTEEANVSFTTQSSTSLRDLERILTIVCEEAEKYDLLKENCIFFASILQEILVWEKYGGHLDSGTFSNRFLSPDARRRIFQRLN